MHPRCVRVGPREPGGPAIKHPTDRRRNPEAVRRYADRLTRLCRLSADIAKLGDERATLQTIVDTAASLLGVESAHLALIDKSEKRLFGVASSGRHRKDVPHLTFDLSESPAARKVLATRRPIAVARAANDPRVNPHARRILRIVSIAYLPLLSGRRSFGLLVMINRRPHAWTDEQLALGRHLAACASIAIENGRLLKRLAETENRLRSLIEHIPAIVYTCEVHPPYRSVYVSPQTLQMLGYSASEWMHDEKGFWMKIVHPDDLGSVIDLTEEAVRRQGFATTEYRVLDRQGEVRWFRDEAVLVRDPAGEPVAWHGVMVEITGMKKMQHDLHPDAPAPPTGGARPFAPEPPAT